VGSLGFWVEIFGFSAESQTWGFLRFFQAVYVLILGALRLWLLWYHLLHEFLSSCF